MAKQVREGSLIDPVAEGQARDEMEQQDREIDAMVIDNLSLADFQPMPVDAARQPHPFEGYPQQKVKIGEYKDRMGKMIPLMVSKTHIVGLSPKEYVHQDPSGKNVSHIVNGKETFVTIKTYHNRIVRDQMGRNQIVQFDREAVFPDGTLRIAIVPDHTARAQLFFTVERKTGKVIPDRRYLLADGEQRGRLRRVFEAFHYQQTRSERLSQKFDEEQESRAQ